MGLIYMMRLWGTKMEGFEGHLDFENTLREVMSMPKKQRKYVEECGEGERETMWVMTRQIVQFVYLSHGEGCGCVIDRLKNQCIKYFGNNPETSEIGVPSFEDSEKKLSQMLEILSMDPD